MPSRTLARLASFSFTFAALATIAIPASAATMLNDVNFDRTSGFVQPAPTPAPVQTPIGQGNTPVQTPIGQGNTPTSASGNNSGTLLVNPLKGITDLPSLLDAIINAIVDIGTIVLILALIWVGFSFVKAQGNEKEIAQARAALLWTIVGGAILLGAKALSEVIQSTVSNL